MAYDPKMELEAIEEYNQDMADMAADDWQEWQNCMEDWAKEQECQC